MPARDDPFLPDGPNFLWRNAKFGMSLDEVRALFPDATETGAIEIESIGQMALELEDIHIAGQEYKAIFTFKHQRLSKIDLLPVTIAPTAIGRAVREHFSSVFSTKYGSAQLPEFEGQSDSLRWHSGDTEIRLLALDMSGIAPVLRVYVTFSKYNQPKISSPEPENSSGINVAVTDENDPKGWRGARWGMVADDLEKTFKAELRKHKREDTPFGTYGLYEIPETDFMGEKARVRFIMSQSSDQLIKVVVDINELPSPERRMQAYKNISTALTKEFGFPGVQTDKGVNDGVNDATVELENTWRFLSTEINLSYKWNHIYPGSLYFNVIYDSK